MITGFNTDVKHKDKVYHVQTEDKGRQNPKIESLVYVGGEILDSHQTTYEGNKADLTEDQIMELLEAQHKRVIRYIKIGRYDQAEDFPEDVMVHEDLSEAVASYFESEEPEDYLKLVVNGLSTLKSGGAGILKINTKKAMGGEVVPDSEVRIKIKIINQLPRLMVRGTTDAGGEWQTEINLPDYPEGMAALEVTAISEWGVASQEYPLRH